VLAISIEACLLGVYDAKEIDAGVFFGLLVASIDGLSKTLTERFHFMWLPINHFEN